MKTLLIGANGQLGSDIAASWPEPLIPLTRRDLDVTDRDAVAATVAHHRPHLVINTAAFHNVDLCETELTSAFAVNAVAARNLADACLDSGAALMHLSTDYVFSGALARPCSEADPPDARNVYGVSKAAGEQLVRQRLPAHFIVRTSGLFGVAGAAGKGGNFVETMLRLAREGRPISVVDDQTLAPTFTADLARKLHELAAEAPHGTYHVTAAGQCSWFDFAREIFARCGLNPDLSPTTTAAFGAKAPRPQYSVLANDALRAAGIHQIRHWREGLADYLARKGHAPAPAARDAT